MEGDIVGVDLARERASANDDVLQAALALPNLKRFRFAGGSVSAESLAGLKGQRKLTELYLQDVPIRDVDWARLQDGLAQLERLTFRRVSGLSDIELGALPQRLPRLQSLSLIEMDLTGESLVGIAKSNSIKALDIRDCGKLIAGDYRRLASMRQLNDLRIGGFAVTDDVLAALAPLSTLGGLTINDSLITAGAFEKFIAEFASADKLRTLVLCRNSSLFDASLLVFKKLPKLNRLTVDGMMVTGSFLDGLAEDEATRPKLQRLSLRKAFLSKEGAAALKKYPELRILDLSGIALPPQLVEIIASLYQLDELDVTDCQFDEDSLRRLQTMETLKRLIR